MKLDLDYDSKRKLKIGDAGHVKFRLRQLAVEPGSKVDLKADFAPGFSGGFKDKTGALDRVAQNVDRLTEAQSRLYASGRYALLIIFQGMDASGKDGVIRHVMSGVNPQGCRVTSFKQPSTLELEHSFLWRASNALPRRGMIVIFNRSHYEEVLVVRVHPELLKKQNLPPEALGKGIWKRRFREINAFESHLVDNGVRILKFFLNVSYEEQRKRFLARIDEPEKNWKFSLADASERKLWNEYQHAYQEMLEKTSTRAAPWFVIPADNKWFARLAVSETICAALDRLDLRYPEVSDARRAELQAIRQNLVDD